MGFRANQGACGRGNDDRRVGTGTRTETGTRRAPLLGSVSLHALPWMLVVGDHCLVCRLGASEFEGLVPT